MSECVDEQYRVQISGPEFSVTFEAGPEEDDLDPDEAHFAALAISGAMAMASYRLPRVTRILANVVSRLLQDEACDVETVRRAEEAFRNAADGLIRAWDEHDAQIRRAIRPAPSASDATGST